MLLLAPPSLCSFFFPLAPPTPTSFLAPSPTLGPTLFHAASKSLIAPLPTSQCPPCYLASCIGLSVSLCTQQTVRPERQTSLHAPHRCIPSVEDSTWHLTHCSSDLSILLKYLLPKGIRVCSRNGPWKLISGASERGAEWELRPTCL